MNRQDVKAPTALLAAKGRDAEASGGVKSARRILQIFELFSQIERGARVSEIAQRLGYPYSSTAALMRCLMDMGYLAYDPANRNFIPTPRLAMIGGWVGNAPFQDGSLTRLLEDVKDQTGGRVTLIGRNGAFVQYWRAIGKVMASMPLLPSQHLLVSSAAGPVLLTEESDDEIRRMVRRANAEPVRKGHRVNADELLEKVSFVRRQGYYFARSGLTPDIGYFGMQLDQGILRDKHPFCVGVAGPHEELARRQLELVAVMRLSIARHLGALTAP